MLINYVPGEESRIAIVREGRLEEFYQERASAESHVGNIYQGKVVNVEPSIQAAFIDFGLERNGFLHISDLHPKYFPGKDREEFEQVGSKTPHRERPPIQKCLRRGETVLVQVLKEGIGTKGPTLTSYLSIPGRFLVMMPDMQRTGVSRKVEDDDARREMRKVLDELNPPKEFGFIIRTAGIGQTKTELKRDLSYLQRLWKNLERRRKELRGPGELYTESDLIIRTIRDVFTPDVDRIVVDDITAARRAHDFLVVASPRSRSKVVFYNGPVPLFHHFDIEQQIESIHARTVPLQSGGSLVIDQTEALVAIDVNSGKSREARDAESNAYNTNLEAVDEICRQLRLRDMGGVVVNDLIDMRSPKHRKAVEARMRENLKRDRARTRIGTISPFGILEMTRQRMRGSLKSSVYTHCVSCAGTGHVKTAESVVLDVMRRLALAMHHDAVARIELTISPDVAFHLLNRKRHALVELEDRFTKPVMVRVGGATVDFVHISAFDARGGSLDHEALTARKDVDPPDCYVELTGTPSELELEIEEETHQETAAASSESAEISAGQDMHRAEAPAPGEAADTAGPTESAGTDTQDGDGKRRRRRRRGGRRRRKTPVLTVGDAAASESDAIPSDAAPGAPPSESQAIEREEVRIASREASSADDAGEPVDPAAAANGTADAPMDTRKRRRRRRRRGRGKGEDANGNGSNDVVQPVPKAVTPPAPVRQPQAGAPRVHKPPPRSDRAVSGGYSNRVLPASKADAPVASSPASPAGADAKNGERP